MIFLAHRHWKVFAIFLAHRQPLNLKQLLHYSNALPNMDTGSYTLQQHQSLNLTTGGGGTEQGRRILITDSSFFFFISHLSLYTSPFSKQANYILCCTSAF